MEKKDRILWADISKGILITLLMFSHLVWVAKSKHDIHNVVIDNLANVCGIWNCFFMACFFVLTGMFSNFNKKFNVFFVANVKSLIVPGLVFLLLFNLPKMNLDYVFLRTFLYGGIFWFLTSLFISKIVLWICLKYIKKSWIVLVSLLCLSFFSKVLDDIENIPNYWYHKNFLNFCLFLAIGYYYKKLIPKRMTGIISGIAFVVPIIGFYIVGNKIPNVVSIFNENLWQHPITVWLSITGSITCIHLCMLIKECAVLEYLGRNSLIIYIYHMTFLGQAIYALKASLNDTLLINSVVMVFMIIVSTLLFCCGLSEVMNMKYLRWMKGVF